MSKTGKGAFGAVLVLFVGFVVYSSFNLDTVSCEVCMEFNGLQQCSSAAGVDELEARNTATTVACSAISSGVTDSIACSNTEPQSVTCQ